MKWKQVCETIKNHNITIFFYSKTVQIFYNNNKNQEINNWAHKATNNVLLLLLKYTLILIIWKSIILNLLMCSRDLLI